MKRTPTSKNRSALLIGCGRMGAGLGSKGPATTSHAGVLALEAGFSLTVYDDDPAMAQRAAKRFGVPAIARLSQSDLENADVAVICTPTDTHADYLKRLIAAGVPVIVCEKPVCNDPRGLRAAELAYRRGNSRVLVNYSRRFLPAYAAVRSTLSKLTGGQDVRAVAVRYQRGFLNNASHALDLLQVLLGWDIATARATVTSSIADEFADDPTLSLFGTWNGADLAVVGLPKVKFSLFEVDVFLERSAVRIRDRGDVVEIGAARGGGGYYAPLQAVGVRSNCLHGALHHLYARVRRMLRDKTVEDNFAASVGLAGWMLDVKKCGVKPCPN
jgi:hypothetical protein